MKSKMEFLAKPGKIGKLELKNRMIMAPMGTEYGTPERLVTERLIDYLEARAKGGASLIIVENTSVCPHEEYGEAILNMLTMWDYNTVGHWKELTDAVHFWGAKVLVQLNYSGYNMVPNLKPGVQAVTPSPVVIRSTYPYNEPVNSREATLEDIQHLVERFAVAARLAKFAGFDGVCLHCAHNYGISPFQSAHLNHRSDEYGGTFENRMRFGLEVFGKMRQYVGDNFVITCRIPVDEPWPDGIHPEESVEIAKKYAEAGADAIDLSYTPPSDVGGRSRYGRLAAVEPLLPMYKDALNVPLIIAGSFNDPVDAERVLGEGKADFIALGKPLLADPEYPNKVIEGRVEDIRKCRRCFDGCLRSHQEYYNPTDCAVNVEVGKERKYAITKAEKVKKVLVVGGGPAGMEAARVAALRGHKVTLCEKSDRLGGNLVPGSIPDFKIEDRWLLDWLSTQIKKAGVKIELGKEITKNSGIGSYDAVILATGAVPIITEIPGVEKAVTAIDVLLGKVEAGKEPIIIGGGEVGCETALYLAEKGHNCTILEMLGDIAVDVPRYLVRPDLLGRMSKANVKWFTGMRATEITDDGVVCLDSKWQKHTFSGDMVILAVGLKSVNGLAEAMRGKVSECYTIGDCVEPRKVFNAIHEGSLIARRI